VVCWGDLARAVARERSALMSPPAWQPLVALSPAEQAISARVRRAKLFVFLRRVRHERFSPAFQAELATIFAEREEGHPPIPPAQLALATILQAYTGVSDDEVLEAVTRDRRWQLVLDCLDCFRPPFSKATLVRFWQALIAHDLDRRLIERSVELAAQDGGFGPRPLRAALDASPLWGAGRIEDTYNLLGHALRKALGVLARQQGRGLAAAAAGAPLLSGSSLKAALDLDRDDPTARAHALTQLLAALDAVEHAVATAPTGAAARPPRRVWRRPTRSRPRISSAVPPAGHGCARASPRPVGSRSKIRRRGMGGRVGRSEWTRTSGTCSPTWPRTWCGRAA
jgi:transposase